MTTPRRRPLLGLALATVVVAACSLVPKGASDVVPSSARAAGRASGTTIPAGFPLGSWTTSISADDLRAGGITDPGWLEENAGEFTMTMSSDGTWTTAQVATAGVRTPVFRGSFEVTGPRTFRQRTQFPPDFVGDVVDFSWAIDDEGALVLDVLTPPDDVLPIIVETHPWKPAA